jgi:hypothetical protein
MSSSRGVSRSPCIASTYMLMQLLHHLSEYPDLVTPIASLNYINLVRYSF